MDKETKGVAAIKEEFTEIFSKNVTRKGANTVLTFLNSTDFFTAPASTKFHGNYEGGLAEHSLNVYHCLKSVVNHLGLNVSEETIAVVALLHDICKVDVYKVGTRNKKINNEWVQVPFYEFDDPIPYGHGEKSVYMISGMMKLSREEAFAIRYHMGYSSTEDARNVSKAFEMFPLAFAISMADQEATYYHDYTDESNK